MADFYELEKRYEKIPQEMKQQRRWICYASRERNGKSIKVPVAPFMADGSLKGAVSTDESTWGDFEKALRFCAENDLEGLGFELGDSGMFAIDLDNDADVSLSQQDFHNMVNDFVATLNSYTEWSVSGNGVHILCYGDVPPNLKLPSPSIIHIYHGAKFFVITGKTIRRAMIKDGSKKLDALLSKYSVSKEKEEKDYEFDMAKLTDEQVKSAMASSKQGAKIARLMEGDCSDYKGNKNEAKQALCNFLAYYSHCDKEQVARLFAASKLVDEEWADQKEEFVGNAIDTCSALYLKTKKKVEDRELPVKSGNVPLMNIDDNGEPIFRISNKIKQHRKYSLDDTGNAQRFYDCFGEHFHWNATDKTYMFWTGKTWIYDTKGIIRKYANQLIVMLREEANQVLEQMHDASDENEKKRLGNIIQAYEKNITRISNKSGKDAMLNELQFIGESPVENTDFNKDPYLLNTDSGIVDLRTGEVKPFDRSLLCSYNTKVKVSFEEPTEWLKFLRSVFEYANPKDTEETIECLRRCLGYTLTGLTKEQVIFLLHGDGSNGKSTLLNVVQAIMGDYFNTIDSSQLMVSKNNQSVAVQNSMAEVLGIRFLSTQETDEGARLSEPTVKHISGDEVINAQKKYGRPFYFLPVFKLWMSTNNLPIIRGKDFGIWRRIFLFPFKKTFTDAEKDKTMPEKLAAEYDKILGWCIGGAVDYLKDFDLKKPTFLQEELSKYQEELDTVLQFINAECYTEKGKVTPKRTMYDAYTQWAKRSNLPALSEPKFKNELIKKGYRLFVRPADHGQYYDGIGVNDNGYGRSNFEEESNPW